MDMSQRLSVWLAECRQPSTAYKIACFIIVLVHVSSGFILMELFLEDIARDRLMLLLRLTGESLMIVAICHICMRPFLRLGILRSGLNGTSFAGLFLYCVPVAGVMSLLMYGIASVSDFSDFDIDSIQFTNKAGETSSHNRSTSAYVIYAGQQYAFLLFWAAVYLSWHFYRKRVELSRELEIARLQQLANQINPHFLFNTLNSIRALVYSDQDKAAETITQLSELMRVHMHAEVATLSRFEQECELAESYLKIELLRLQERLTVRWDVAPSVATVQMPSLVLLTLLENAVKYGIAPSSKAGVIDIEAKLVDDKRFRLTVSNSLPEKSAEKGNGIGLKNIEKRLQLLYADQAALSIKHAQQFTAVVEFPVP